MLDFGKYIKSLAGGPPASHSVRQAMQLILGAVFAGYTATALPAGFLKLFEHPVVQFGTFFLLFNQIIFIHLLQHLFFFISLIYQLSELIFLCLFVPQLPF